MRFARFELIRYGKFTDRSLEFPKTEHDFHLIVGPNEAGKSTVRAALVDLLYSIPKKTPHAFLHAKPDLRLGATIEHEGSVLEFSRIKANKQTMQDRSGKPLPDGALSPYLGANDRDFFTQMFSLDHQRLVEGGLSILSASNDLGQILFQSAAGVNKLGEIRKALAEEADRLWSKRKSNDRLYYIAAEKLQQATSALKEATMKARDWAATQTSVNDSEEALGKAKDQYTGTRTRRNVLERVRRLAPHLNTLDECKTAIAKFDLDVEMPDTAAKDFLVAQKETGSAQVDINHQSSLIIDMRNILDRVVVDEKVLQFRLEIERLNEKRIQYQKHEEDLGKRQAEIDAHLQVAFALAAQLDWESQPEEALRGRIPSLPVRSVLSGLIHSTDALQQNVESAKQAERRKQSEIADAKRRLEKLSVSDVPVSLQSALSRAQKLGDISLQAQQREQLVRSRTQSFNRAVEALGKERRTVQVLRSMSIPAPEIIDRFVQDQLGDDAVSATQFAQSQSFETRLREARLEATQYQKLHQPVTRDEVLGARKSRQDAWETIKSNPAELPNRTAFYQQLVKSADDLADRSQESAQEASELLSKLGQVERSESDLKSADLAKANLDKRIKSRLDRWSALTQECGLPPISYDSTAQWIQNRKSAIEASDLLEEAVRASEEFDATYKEVRAQLAEGLIGLWEAIGDESLEDLIIGAESLVQKIREGRGQRKSLEHQISEAEREIESLTHARITAAEKVENWQCQWDNALKQAAMPPETDVHFGEGMLEVFLKVEAQLELISKIRIDRIDTMRSDLAAFSDEAKALAGVLAPDLAQESAAKISLFLTMRLTITDEAQRESQRLQSTIEATQTKLKEAESRKLHAQALLAPLFKRSGTTSPSDLEAAIERSDDRRLWSSTQAKAEEFVKQSSDGIPIEQLRVETQSVDLSNLSVELDNLAVEELRLVAEQTDASTRLLMAKTELAKTGGSEKAAKAEAERQEALSEMGDAVGRYIKAHTAARLLKWSIERYREAKQGPMLSAASTIFFRLTLGSFDRLVVDFESELLQLLGHRPDGTLVDIEGMSDGTRDQLYMSLRLAALDMHLSQAHVLPFIADDLFINNDDNRSKAGLEALRDLSKTTQVLFLTHHDHLLTKVEEVFQKGVNVIRL